MSISLEHRSSIFAWFSSSKRQADDFFARLHGFLHKTTSSQVSSQVKEELTPDQFLSEIGRENEVVRREHESVVSKVKALLALEDDIARVFARTDAIMDDLEVTKSELAKREALGRFEREARDAAVLRANGLAEERERLCSDLELSRSEATRVADALRTAEARLQDIDIQIVTLRDDLAITGRDLALQCDTAHYALQDLEAVRAELKLADQLAARRGTEIAESEQRLAIADQLAHSLGLGLAEAQNALAQSRTDADDLSVGLETSRHRISNLESELQTRQQEHAQMRGLWQGEADQHRADVAALQTELDKARAVAGVHERLLEELRAEAEGTGDALKQAERRALEAETAADHNHRKLLAAETARDSAQASFAAAKSQQKVLVRRVKPLITALRAKQAEAHQSAERTADLESRLEAKTRETVSLAGALEQRLTSMIAELEAEKSRRILAEGALSSDRHTRINSRITQMDTSARAPDDRVAASVALDGGLQALRPRAMANAARLNRVRRPGEAA